jgi:hypothetical protein
MSVVLEAPSSPSLISGWDARRPVDAVLLVRVLDDRTKRDDSPFLRLVLGDRSSTIPTVRWDLEEGARPAVLGAPCYRVNRSPV